MLLKCAECKCNPLICSNVTSGTCKNCITVICCCITIHKKNNKWKKKFELIAIFFANVKSLYAAALGIEILCITAAEIGENSIFVLFNYTTLHSISLGYILGYGLSAFTTFVTILGRYDYNSEICSCCSILEQESNKSFMYNVFITFKNFACGLRKLLLLYQQPNLKTILKTSIIILITAESVCIVTAETVDLLFYNYSKILSIFLSILAGAFTVVIPEAYKKTMKSMTVIIDNNNNSKNISFK